MFIIGYNFLDSSGLRTYDSIPKALPVVCSRLYSFKRSCNFEHSYQINHLSVTQIVYFPYYMVMNDIRTLLFAMNRPPLLIQPGLIPVSSSILFTNWFIWLRSWISVSLGRSLHTNPAVCHVVPSKKQNRCQTFNCIFKLYAQIFTYCLNTRSSYFLPVVSLSFSMKSVFVTPSLAKWYKVWQPRLPPPINNIIIPLKDCLVI